MGQNGNAKKAQGEELEGFAWGTPRKLKEINGMGVHSMGASHKLDWIAKYIGFLVAGRVVIGPTGPLSSAMFIYHAVEGCLGCVVQLKRLCRSIEPSSLPCSYSMLLEDRVFLVTSTSFVHGPRSRSFRSLSRQ